MDLYSAYRFKKNL